MKKIALCISATLFIAITSLAQSSGKIVLTKGQKFIEETSSSIVISQEAMGQSMESKIDLKSANIIEVKDVKDTSYTLTNTITKMKMNMSAMGQDMAYDSDKQDNDSTMSKSIGKILNKPKDVDINKTGKVINKADGEKEEPDSEANMMTGLLQSVLGNAEDGSLGLTLALQAIPPKTNVGFSWSDSLNKEGTTLNTTYTIKELKGNDATVSIKGNMQVSQKTKAQEMEITNNSTGTMTGELIIDIISGIVKQRNTALETTGTVEVMGQQIPMTTKVTSAITVKSM